MKIIDIVTAVGLYIIVVLFLYALFAFAIWEANPKAWDTAIRVPFCFFCFFFILVPITYLVEKSPTR